MGAEQLLQRAREMGARDPQHYLFPFKVTRSKQAFPDRHMTESGIKKLWEEVRLASGLREFRPYDTRHTAITLLAEGAVPISTIMKRAGHVSAKMTEHYTHISDASQIQSVRAAQRYNGGLGQAASHLWNPPPPRADIMHSAIQAEIARQVALALQQYAVSPEAPTEAQGPGLIQFPAR